MFSLNALNYKIKQIKVKYSDDILRSQIKIKFSTFLNYHSCVQFVEYFSRFLK